MRLLFVGNAPVRYHTPVFNALAKHVDLHVLFMTRTDQIYGFRDAWGVKPEFAHSYYWSCTLPVAALDTRIQLSVGVSQRIHRLKPDVIVVHSWQPIGVEPVAWARLTRRAASVMWAESWARSGRLRGRIPTGLRRAYLRNVDAFVSSGSQATAYLRFLRVDPDRIVTSCYPSPLQQPPSCVAANTRSEITRFLYVGRLVPRKHPLEVLRAFADVKRARPATTLDIVGDGPLAARRASTGRDDPGGSLPRAPRGRRPLNGLHKGRCSRFSGNKRRLGPRCERGPRPRPLRHRGRRRRKRLRSPRRVLRPYGPNLEPVPLKICHGRDGRLGRSLGVCSRPANVPRSVLHTGELRTRSCGSRSARRRVSVGLRNLDL